MNMPRLAANHLVRTGSIAFAIAFAGCECHVGANTQPAAAPTAPAATPTTATAAPAYNPTAPPPAPEPLHRRTPDGGQ